MIYLKRRDHILVERHFYSVRSALITYPYFIDDLWVATNILSFVTLNQRAKLFEVEAVFIDCGSEEDFVFFGFWSFAQPICTQSSWKFVDEYFADTYFLSQVTAMLSTCWSENYQSIWNSHSQQLACALGHEFVCYLNVSLSYLFNRLLNSFLINLLPKLCEFLMRSLAIESFISIFAEYFGEISLV